MTTPIPSNRNPGDQYSKKANLHQKVIAQAIQDGLITNEHRNKAHRHLVALTQRNPGSRPTILEILVNPNEGILNQAQINELKVIYNKLEAPQQTPTPPYLGPKSNSPKDLDPREEALKAYRIAVTKYPLFSPRASLAYETIDRLGQGAMGAVFKVKDRRLGREGALKIMLQQPNAHASEREISEYHEAKARFEREAKITSRLVHPGIPPVYDAGENEKGIAYMVMRVVAGEELADKINKFHGTEDEEITLRSLLEMLTKVSEAVAYAHSEGIIHRDLKPANVMVGDFGEVFVMDWGLAKDGSNRISNFIPGSASSAGNDISQSLNVMVPRIAGVDLTNVGEFIGTPIYASPKQAMFLGSEAEPVDDVFSLGVMLTEILTGEWPSQPEKIKEELSHQTHYKNNPGALNNALLQTLLLNTAQGKYASPIQINPNVSKELNSLAMKAMEHSEANRADSKFFAEELKRFLAGEELLSHSYNRKEKASRFLSKHSKEATVALMSTLTLLVAMIAALLVNSSNQAKDKADLERKAAQAKTKAIEANVKTAEAEARSAEAAKKAADRINKNRSSADKLLSTAEAELRKGNRKTMDALIQRALKVFPDNKFPTAAYYLKAAELYSKSPNGDKELGLRMLGKAEEMLEEAIKLEPPGYNALFLMNEIKAKKLGKTGFSWTDALNRLIKTAKENNDENEFTFFAEASRAHEDGNLKRSEELYTESLRYSPDFVATLTNRGIVRIGLGKYLDALKDFKHALEIDPTHPRIYLAKATAQQKLNLHKGAIEDLTITLSREPANLLALRHRAESYLLTGQLNNAIQDISKVIERKPISNDYNMRASALLGLKDPRKALEDTKKALELEPENINALLTSANAKYSLGNIEDAINDFIKITKIKPIRPIAHEYLGNIYLKQKNYNKALFHFQRLIEHKPNHKEAAKIKDIIRQLKIHLGK